MTARTFLDANILVYADDNDLSSKQSRAQELIESALLTRRGVISTQVLGEYFCATTRKLKTSPLAAGTRVELFRTLEVVLIQPEDVAAAIDLVRLRSISYWDALIVRSALRSGCRFLMSEDLNAGERLNGLEIVNPFV